jgi:hypothetical protein
MKRDKEKGVEPSAPVYTEFVRKDEEEKGKFNLFILILIMVIFSPSGV